MHSVVEGDCLDVLKGMESESVDAVVTDPPYGLSKEPDVAEVMTKWLAGEDYEHRGGGFMGKSWDSFVPGPSVWREVYRVMKPGAHLLCFSGTRTWDLMSMAIRLAGFENRDTIRHHFGDGPPPAIAWCYGSGFPKSLSVGKAIDKIAYQLPLFEAIRLHIRTWRDKHGLDNVKLAELLGLTPSRPGMVRHWTSESGTQHSIPTKDFWFKLKAVLEWPDCELDALYESVVNGAERPVVGKSANVARAASIVKANGGGNIAFGAGSLNDDITAPATEAAKQWEGWGTALKPSWEVILVFRKPLSESSVARNVLEHGTGALNIDATRVGTQDDRSRPPRTPNAIYGNGNGTNLTATESHPSGRWPSNLLLSHVGGPNGCRPTGEMKRVKAHWSQPTSGGSPDGNGIYGKGMPRGSGENVGYANPDGTEEVAEYICARDEAGNYLCPVALLDLQSGQKTPSYRNGNRKARSMFFGEDGKDQSGAGYRDSGGASRFFKTFGGTDDGEAGMVPNGHGLGSRVDGVGGPNGASLLDSQQFHPDTHPGFIYKSKASRAQRNLGLDSTLTVKYSSPKLKKGELCAEMVALLRRVTSDTETANWVIGESGESIMGLCPSGTLSTILTAIKRTMISLTSPLLMLSPTNEYTRGANCELENGGSLVSDAESLSPSPPNTTQSQTAYTPSVRLAISVALHEITDKENWKPLTNFHATVKSLALCDYLVRLITPPGGTCLDPFAGSGSTGCSAVRQGFNFIGIEMSSEYCEIARKRISYWSQPEEVRAREKGKPTKARNTYGFKTTDVGRRCPEHGEPIPSGSTTYKCGCEKVWYKTEPESSNQAETLEESYPGALPMCPICKDAPIASGRGMYQCGHNLYYEDEIEALKETLF